jgi:CDP-4-dehydro-6-deoxyglucose reductase, E3
MATIRFADHAFSVAPGESVLDILLKQGQPIPNSCRAGVCQSCLLRATEGEIPKQAQTGIKDTLRAQGYFLACRCQPADDMVVELPKESDVRLDARVIGPEPLAAKIIRLRLRPTAPFDYRSGQHVTLWRDETLGRSYSLASVPVLDEPLEFHIRVIPDGQFSAWAHKELRIGNRVALQGPTRAVLLHSGLGRAEHASVRYRNRTGASVWHRPRRTP